MCTFLAVLGGCMLFMAWIFDGSGLMPVVLRMWLRYWISLVKKWHLLCFMDRCAFHNFLKTYLMWLRCSFAVLLKMMMSTRWAIVKEKSFKTPVISSWNMLVLAWVQKVLWCIHICQMVRWMLCWVLKIHPKEYCGILHVDPILRSTLI